MFYGRANGGNLVSVISSGSATFGPASFRALLLFTCEVLQRKPLSKVLQEQSAYFLLSPANAAGKRAQLLMREARRSGSPPLQNGGLPLGEAFSFISGLYFRGKLVYATAFSSAQMALPGR